MTRLFRVVAAAFVGVALISGLATAPARATGNHKPPVATIDLTAACAAEGWTATAVLTNATNDTTLTAVKVRTARTGGQDLTLTGFLVVGATAAPGATLTGATTYPDSTTTATIAVKVTWKQGDRWAWLETNVAAPTCTSQPSVEFADTCEGTTITLTNAAGAAREALFTVAAGDFSADVKVAPGSTETETFKPEAGPITVAAGEREWTWTWKTPAGGCATPTPTATASAPAPGGAGGDGELPLTGAGTGLMVAVALGLLLAGGVAIVAMRARRTRFVA